MGGYAELQQLAHDFWAWAAVNRPYTGDDITRLERPWDWVPDWTRPAITRMKDDIAAFDARYKAIDPAGLSVEQKTDHSLVGSAIARTHWELHTVRNWQRNPVFYVDQAVGPLFENLVIPPPFGADRQRHLLLAMGNIKALVEAAKSNLDECVLPFAEIAIEKLGELTSGRLEKTASLLQPHLSGDVSAALLEQTQTAVSSLRDFTDFLKARKDRMASETAIGRDAYKFFLERCALVDLSPEELVRMARQEWERCVALQTIEEHRSRNVPDLPLAINIQEQMDRNERADVEIRRFLHEQDLLTVPDWLRRYRNDPTPDYLEPIADWGCLDDLTSASRLDEDGRRYISPPGPELGYFQKSAAQDPRPLLVHEGIPGHYMQLAVSWKHPNFIRRYFYDSIPNEGIGFYAEEMMLQAGYFDDSLPTRRTIYSWMRLRALRVEVDVKLALGEFTIQQAADFLAQAVPMDRETAEWEAMFFAAVPAQAISYQVGKCQVMAFLTAARTQLKDKFNLRHFHDYLWLNGNVPIALLQKEYLSSP